MRALNAARFYWRLSRNYDHPWPLHLSLRGRLQFTLKWTAIEMGWRRLGA